MNSEQSPTTTPAKKRSMSPLTLVLLLSGGFFVLFLVISSILFFRSPGTPSGSSGAAAIFRAGSIGVIDVNGVILDSKKTIKQLERFEEDDSIKGIVIRLNSPGGSVAPSQEIYETVKRIDREKKPIYASMQSVAASGAYYIAAGARRVYANAGTITGSIGVIMEFANLSRLYDWAKIKRYAIKTGKYKDVGSDFREMTEDERALLQGMIDDVLGQFKAAVMEGRKLKASQLDPIADGRILSGQQAKTVKLVDEIGTFQDTVNALAKEVKIKGKPVVVQAKRARPRILDLLMDEGSRDPSDSESSRSILERVLGRLAGTALSEQALPPGIYWLWSGAR